MAAMSAKQVAAFLSCGLCVATRRSCGPARAAPKPRPKSNGHRLKLALAPPAGTTLPKQLRRSDRRTAARPW
eukprot:scaffold481_cov238-Pinguiococcus_pyrenoidosus.AAC.4